MWNDDLFFETVSFAIRAHNGQFMKYPNDLPYDVHLFGVFATLVNNGGDVNDVNWDFAAQLALLHDILEDTKVTFDELRIKFGELVAEGVLALTRNENLPQSIQMEDCIKRIKKQPKEVAMVKMADRLFNIRKRVPIWSSEKQDNYKKEAIKICQELGYASTGLKNALELAINNY